MKTHRKRKREEKIQDPTIHICEQCNLPILIYGRLIHCKHILCYSCAGKAQGTCPYCEEHIERIEKGSIGEIYVCSYGQCHKCYLSQRDLTAHIRHRHKKDKKESSRITDSELLQQGLLPFVTQPPISVPSASQVNLHNPVMMPAMPPPAQPPIFVDRMPMLLTQPQFQSMPQNMPILQPQYQPQAYIPHSQYQGIPQPQQSPNMQNTQPQVQRPDDMQVRTSGPMQPVQQAPPPPPPPPQGEWRGGPPNQMPGNPPQDWNQQGRTGNYLPQYFK